MRGLGSVLMEVFHYFKMLSCDSNSLGNAKSTNNWSMKDEARGANIS